jgi:hypothetical protein
MDEQLLRLYWLKLNVSAETVKLELRIRMRSPL